MDTSEAIHKTKVDKWIYLIILGPTLMAAIALAAQVYSNKREPDLWFGLEFFFVLSLPLLLSAFLGNISYKVGPDKLRIRVWGIPWGTIAIKDITAVVETGNPLSAPAASLDRLRISTEARRIAGLISPEDKQKFLKDLAARDRGLEIVELEGKLSLHRQGQ